MAEGKDYPEGWTRTNGWGQKQSGLEGTYATAYYNHPGSLQYGNQGVYTMPLAAQTTYIVTVSYRSHENESNTGMTISVLNDAEKGLAAEQFAANPSKSEWMTVSKEFKTDAAGNYVLTLANGGNTWITNVSITRGEKGTTGIQELKNSRIEELKSSDIYNMNGQKVEKAGKGLYIKNGKKVIMK